MEQIQQNKSVLDHSVAKQLPSLEPAFDAILSWKNFESE